MDGESKASLRGRRRERHWPGEALAAEEQTEERVSVLMRAWFSAAAHEAQGTAAFKHARTWPSAPSVLHTAAASALVQGPKVGEESKALRGAKRASCVVASIAH